MSKSDSKARIAKYQATVLDLYVDSRGTLDDISQRLIEASRGKIIDGSIEQVMLITWAVIRKESDYILGQFAVAKLHELEQNQRNYYMSARYCIEAMADLLYLYKHQEELGRYFTDSAKIQTRLGEIYKNETISSEKKAREVSKLLREGQLKGQIIDRVADLSPELLREYAVYCLYTHPTYEGHQLYFHCDESYDMMFCEICHTLTLVLQHLIAFLRANCKYFAVDKELLKGLVAQFYDNDRRMRNVYYAKHYSEFKMTKAEMNAELEKIYRAIDQWD